MAVTVHISATLRNFVNHKSQLSGEGGTVGEVLKSVTAEYPDLEKVLYEGNGSVREFINIYVGSEEIRQLQGLDTAVTERDSVLLLPAIAGGKPAESIIARERSKEVLLEDKEVDRYSKHLLLREIGIKGQKRIKASKVLIAGLGGLGAAVAQYLAAAGVGTIGLADFDLVDVTNLQNQVIHGTRDVKRPKVMSARDSVKAINPLIKIEIYNEKLDADNVEEIIQGYDVVVDATDNYKARYLLSDACVLAHIPDVVATIYQFEGRVGVYAAEEGPCLRCQFPAPPPGDLIPSCASGGVISPLPGVLGSYQAIEVLKLLIGGGESLIGENLVVDTWNNTTVKIRVPKRPDCPVCGEKPTVTQVYDFDYDDFCGLKESEDDIPVEGIEPEELARRVDAGEELTIVDVREPHERAISRFPNALVIPIGQLVRRQKELNPEVDTVFVCREGKRSILAIHTLREAGYKGPMYNLKGGMEAGRDLILPHEGAWL